MAANDYTKYDEDFKKSLVSTPPKWENSDAAL